MKNEKYEMLKRTQRVFEDLALKFELLGFEVSERDSEEGRLYAFWLGSADVGKEKSPDSYTIYFVLSLNFTEPLYGPDDDEDREPKVFLYIAFDDRGSGPAAYLRFQADAWHLFFDPAEDKRFEHWGNDLRGLLGIEPGEECLLTEEQASEVVDIMVRYFKQVLDAARAAKSA